MIVLHDWNLDGDPSEPFERGGTPRATFHRCLLRLVEAGAQDGTWASDVERWWRVAQFDWYGPPGCFDIIDVDRTNDRKALRSDGDVAHVTERQQDHLDADSGLWQILAEIPADIDLHDLSANEFDATFESGSAIRRMIERLGSHEIDRTTAFVLLARVRPRLVPVDDRLIGTTLGLRIDEPPVRFWWWALHHDAEIVAALRTIRMSSERLAGLSLLRVAEALVFSRTEPSDAADDRS